MHVGWGGGKHKLDRLSINTGGKENRMAAPYLTGWPLLSGTRQLEGTLSVPGPGAVADPWSIIKMEALRTCQIYINSECDFTD